MAVTLTSTQVLLLQLIIANVIQAAIDDFASLTDEEVQERIGEELTRKNELMKKLKR